MGQPYAAVQRRPADTIGRMEPDADAGLDGLPATLPIGRAGRLEAVPLSAAGDHAVLVHETTPQGRRRALLTTDKLAAGERLVVMPLDDEVEVRVDGDALAVWLGSGSIQQLPPEQRPLEPGSAPAWATLVGGALLLLVLAFAVIGSAVAFNWLLDVLG
jgi:hypothetical protein